jgi:hypothetical protein
MRRTFLTAALALAVLGFSAVSAQADGPFPCKGPFCNQPYPASIGHGYSAHPILAHLAHKPGPILPVYQAAPWYLYWPYDAHFMTPAPVFGAPYPMGGFGHGGYPYFPIQNPYPMSMNPYR